MSYVPASVPARRSNYRQAFWLFTSTFPGVPACKEELEEVTQEL